MTTPSQAKPEPTPRGYLWPVLIVGLLSAHATLMIVTMVIANSDRSFAVEPDYYQKAVRWEDSQRQTAANDSLGWRLVWDIAQRSSASGDREVKCRLENSTGVVLDGAQVELELFPHSRAQERRQLKLARVGDGVYLGRFAFDFNGVWEFRAGVRRGPDIFTSTQTVVIKQ